MSNDWLNGRTNHNRRLVGIDLTFTEGSIVLPGLVCMWANIAAHITYRIKEQVLHIFSTIGLFRILVLQVRSKYGGCIL